jgi:hypothetical protein
VRERSQRSKLHPLRSIGDEFLGGPTRRGNAASQVIDLVLRDVNMERPDLGGGVDGGVHDALRSGQTPRLEPTPVGALRQKTDPGSTAPRLNAPVAGKVDLLSPSRVNGVAGTLREPPR